jgi:hypothetical protein
VRSNELHKMEEPKTDLDALRKQLQTIKGEKEGLAKMVSEAKRRGKAKLRFHR